MSGKPDAAFIGPQAAAAAALIFLSIGTADTSRLPQVSNPAGTSQSTAPAPISTPADIPTKIGGMQIPEGSDLARMHGDVAKSDPMTQPRDHGK